jgi:hypothetical protein
MLEEYSILEASSYGKIRSLNDSIEYMYRKKKMDLNHSGWFTKFTKELVQQWDILGIRKEEQLNSNMNPSSLIYATRVIKLKKQYEIDTITFKNFYKLGRDN